MFRPGEVALPWITSLSQIQNTFEILQLRTKFETDGAELENYYRAQIPDDRRV